MAVKWSWDEFDAEHSIVLTSGTHEARYSNYNLMQFFAKYGKITSFVRLNASKCIAIAKYVSKSCAEDALNADSVNFYGLEMKRLRDHPRYSQFDISMYSYMNGDNIEKILRGFSTDNDDDANNNDPEPSNEPEISPCMICNGEYCLPNECLTKAWIEGQAQPEVEDVVAPPPTADYFEDELVEEPPVKSSKLDMDLLDVDMIESEHHLIDDQKTPEFTIPNKSKVYMTHVASSSTVFVRSANENDNLAYLKLIRAIAGYCDQAVGLAEIPEEGDIIAALFEGIYYRCRVIYVFDHTDDAVVDFIDFGNVEKIQLSDARYLAQEFQMINPKVQMITLKGMTNKNAEAFKHLKSLVSEFKKMILVYENGPSESELIDEKTGKSINAYLRDVKKIPQASPVLDKMKIEPKAPKPSVPQRPQMKEIEYVLANGRNVPVLTISNSLIMLGYIHTILESDMEKFKTNDELVNKIGREMESLPPYSATIPGELCMVKLFNEYYRAILTDSKYNSRDRYELIDYGYVLPVKNENIRRLPDNLLFPCITLKCFLDVLSPVNTKMSRLTEKEAKRVQTKFPQYEVFCFKRIKSKRSYDCCICSI